MIRPPIEELAGLVDRATPGPWRWNVHALSKRARIEGGVPRFDLTVIDFVRWGMGGAAPRFRETDKPGLNIMHRCDEHLAKVPGREHHFEWFADIDHPDAKLPIAAVNSLPALLAYVAHLESLAEARGRAVDAANAAHAEMMEWITEESEVIADCLNNFLYKYRAALAAIPKE